MNRWVHAGTAALVGILSASRLAAQAQPSTPAKPDTTVANPSAEKDDAAAEELNKRLEAADAKAALVKDMTADFEQSKHTALLKKPLVSSGAIRVKESAMRWETRRPHESVLAMSSVGDQDTGPSGKDAGGLRDRTRIPETIGIAVAPP